jgi:sortase A
MSATPAATRGQRRRARRKLTVLGLFGELLITAGVLVLLFLGWQLWFNDIVFGASQGGAAEELSEQWAQEVDTPDPTPGSGPEPDDGEPVVMAAPAANVAFANLIVPRLGVDFKRPIAEGVGTTVLNSAKLGTGHYTSTAMPGGMGNFALSAHRTAYGGAFHNIHQLVVGDAIFVETKDGWYKYVFRSLEYVRANGVGVILPVPQQPGVDPTERIITLTTCNPFLSSAERIIAYGVYDSWYPRSGGAPLEISGVASAAGAR